MVPWLSNPVSLLQMYQQSPPQQGGFFSQQSMRDPQTYWANVNAQRKPGQSNWDTFMRGMLLQSMWPPAYAGAGSAGKDDDRSDQTRRGNQSDPGNTMAPSGATGGPDNTAMSGYDPNTVAGYDPGWMQMFAGMRRPNMNMGMLGLNMLQPRYPSRPPGPYPWI